MSDPSRHRQQNERPPSQSRSAAARPRPSQRRPPREEYEESKCSYMCSRRGIVLICAVLTNALVLICVVAAMMSMSGMSAAGGLSSGSFNLDAQLPFEGTELQQVRDLDMQYSQMRAPGVYGGVTFSLVMGVVSLLFVVSGGKPAYALPRRLLIGTLAFQAAGAVAYVVAVALYLHFVTGVNSTDVCKKRERLYAGRGHTWMNCSVSGGDAAVALFGVITAILYAAGAFLTYVTLRNVTDFHREQQQRNSTRTHTHTPSDTNTQYSDKTYI
uniref:MARVEL domain-containing protein n=2 Tax=Denticeps clupeoides TaxID=299321 RepID=A0AAY4CRX4_9TELE